MIVFNTFLSNFLHVNTFKLIKSGNFIICKARTNRKLQLEQITILDWSEIGDCQFVSVTAATVKLGFGSDSCKIVRQIRNFLDF